MLRSPWTAALLIAVAAAGVALPWQREFGFSERGWSFNEGLIALVAAFEAAIVCALRLAGRIRLWSYVALGLCCATAGFGAVVWFHITVVGEVKPTVYPLLVWWLNGPRSETGLQESVSAAGFIGVIALLVWQLWQGRREFR